MTTSTTTTSPELDPHWSPRHGQETRSLQRRLTARIPDEGQRSALLETAGRILGHGPKPSSRDDSRIGLGLGYVQSGKTTSFTALSALAADNGYHVVIAFLGKTTLLTDLNTGELRSMLGIDAQDDWAPRWHHLEQPGRRAASDVSRLLQAGKVLLVTLLKHPKHIDAVAEMVAAVPEVGEAPVLVIDDEADQASLNTRGAQGEESRTYEAIGGLVAALGPHLYVQYTATPFAPLLLEAADRLSPAFVEPLTPGPTYCGGEEFFVRSKGRLVRPISEDEAADKNPASVPEGLRRALGTFMVSAALVKATRATRPPVSMLVHPSHLREVHRDYFGLVGALRDAWRARLHRRPGDPGRDSDLAELATYYEDFVRHGAPTVPWDDLVDDVVWALDEAKLWLVNSDGDAKRIRWDQSTVHVLVGGNILDRGFVVKGLTVTYLTRGSQVSQADTVEQRARAFGYKRDYLDYCRFFAPPSVLDAFTSLVHTEADMRARLLDHVEAGRPLAEWGRDVGLLLPTGMQPARKSVLGEVQRLNAAGPFHSARVPALEPEAIAANRAAVEAMGVLEAPTRRFGDVLEHPVLEQCDISVVLDLLDAWVPGDSPGWEHSMLRRYVAERHRAGYLPTMHVLLMSNRGQPRRHAWRGPDLGMGNLLQGRDAGTGYPGDRYLMAVPQLQVHLVRPVLGGTDGPALHTLVMHVPDDGRYPNRVARRYEEPRVAL